MDIRTMWESWVEVWTSQRKLNQNIEQFKNSENMVNII